MSKPETLSTEATLVMGGTFGWGAILTYRMTENVPSPEIRKALDELFEAGLILEEVGSDDMPKGALRYIVNPLYFDSLPEFRDRYAGIIESGDYPKIRMFVKRDEATP
jgi:hypothetical protein